MDEDYDEIEPRKRISTRNLVIIIIVIVAIAGAAYFSSSSRNSDSPIKLSELSLTSTRFTADIVNDGTFEFDVDRIDITPGDLNCYRYPKGVEPGETQSISCRASDITRGVSYVLIAYVTDVSDESEYKVSNHVVAKPG